MFSVTCCRLGKRLPPIELGYSAGVWTVGNVRKFRMQNAESSICGMTLQNDYNRNPSPILALTLNPNR